MKKNLMPFLALLMALASASVQAQAQTQLVITGSSTMAPMIAELAKRFRARHPGVEITVEEGGSGRGIADALAGKADIGMVSRELAAKEKALFHFPIARDGIAFIVHKDNRLRAITKAQALAVFTGKVGNWAALGAAAAPIEAVTRGPLDASTDIMSHYLGLEPAAIKGTREAAGNDAVLRLVGATRNAISFVSVGAAEGAAQKGMPVRLLALEHHEPGSATVRGGRWPLSRPLNLVTRKVPAGTAGAFIEFALSAEAQPVIVMFDYVPYLK